MQSVDIEALNQQIYADSAIIEKIQQETNKVIVGQDHMINRLLLGLLTKGHVLLEGLPGLAKTLAIKTLSQVLHVPFSPTSSWPTRSTEPQLKYKVPYWKPCRNARLPSVRIPSS